MASVVICDDDDLARRVIRGVLSDAGWDVVGEAGRALDALEVVRRTEPEVLVLDVALPGVTGLEAIAAFNEASPSTAIVLLSAFDLADDEVTSSGAAAAVQKADLQSLPDVLRSCRTRAGATARRWSAAARIEEARRSTGAEPRIRLRMRRPQPVD